MTDRRIERLVRKAARGDAHAFARVYDAFADRVYGFVRLRVDDARDAEELTETVFLKAWQALPTYRQLGLPFSAWLFRIARNAVIDGHRRTARAVATVEIDEAGDVADSGYVDAEVFRRIEADRLRAAVGRLTEEQAAVVTMRFLWGLALKDAAAVMDRTEGAVKALQHRALRTLARMLAEESPE
jgi:RNA polymerase sigma-70 factor (ECF subfamily)